AAALATGVTGPSRLRRSGRGQSWHAPLYPSGCNLRCDVIRFLPLSAPSHRGISGTMKWLEQAGAFSGAGVTPLEACGPQPPLAGLARHTPQVGRVLPRRWSERTVVGAC